MQYTQKIFDTTAGWCFYTLSTITATPTSGQTTPNHTNNLVAGSHSVISAAPDSPTPQVPDLIWKWDRTANPFGSALALAGIGSTAGVTLTYVAAASNRNAKLQLSHTSVGDHGVYFPLTGVVLPHRFELIVTIEDSGSMNSASQLGLILPCTNGLGGSSMYGLACSFGGLGAVGNVAGYSFEGASGLTTGPMPVPGSGLVTGFGGIEYRLLFERASGAVATRPDYVATAHVSGLNLIKGDTVTSKTYGSWVAGWNTQVIETLGIGLYTIGSQGTFTFDIRDIVIMKHPKDC